jgi:hypothetical protein
LLKNLLSIDYFAWGRVIKCVSPPTISDGGEWLILTQTGINLCIGSRYFECRTENSVFILKPFSFRLLTLEKTGMLPL